MIIGISASLKQDIICRYNLQDCQRIEKYQIKEGDSFILINKIIIN